MMKRELASHKNIVEVKSRDKAEEREIREMEKEREIKTVESYDISCIKRGGYLYLQLKFVKEQYVKKKKVREKFE